MNKNIMKKRKNNGGFTLVELVVTMAVFAIVMTQVATIVFNCSRLYTKGVDHVDLQTEAQRVIQLTEELMVDATDSISENASIYPGSNEISITTSTVSGNKYQYDIYLKKDNLADETGKVYLRKTDLTAGKDNADEVIAEDVKSISVDMANYATDDRVTVSISMKSDDYEYESYEIKDIYLRNDIGSGNKDGESGTKTGNYVLDVRRYAKYPLTSLYGNEYTYEFEANDNEDKKYYSLSPSLELTCGHALNTNANMKTSCVINAYKKTDKSKKSPEFTIVCNTQKVRVGLGDEGVWKGSAIAYGNSRSDNTKVTSFADVVGITLDKKYCESECKFYYDNSRLSGDEDSFGEGESSKFSLKLDGSELAKMDFKYQYDASSESYYLIMPSGFDVTQGSVKYPEFMKKDPGSFYAKIDVYYPEKKKYDTHLSITVYFASIGDSKYAMSSEFFDKCKEAK